MSGKALLRFQEEACESGKALFLHARDQLRAAGEDAAARDLVVAHNGYLLIEAPTGAGKTLIAGNIVEGFSAEEEVVWFWFAPFKGVVGQTANALREEFAGLRLRDLQEDRAPESTRRGDVFVTTWQSVATRAKDSRNVRKDGEENPSIDGLVEALRAAGLRIGVVVDEAHHGFHGDTQAAVFFREVLRPEYTVLVTATPDDADIEDFKKRLGIPELHRIRVSRREAVEAGLIKQGVKCAAYFVDAEKRSMVDLEGTALRDGVRAHQALKRELEAAGAGLVPLLLVQAKDQAGVAGLRERVLAMGFQADQVRTHTANEPDSGLLAIANDETVEVLIFVMAVALGFDAPRAFTLVSMRAGRDTDFGIQLVGRILRVHRKLHKQARSGKLTENLRHGYVFLSDPDTQTGLDKAGQLINQIQTEYAKISPATAIAKFGGQAEIRQVEHGQFRLFPPESSALPLSTDGSGVAGVSAARQSDPGFDFGEFFNAGPTPGDLRYSSGKAESRRVCRYELRADVPRRFKTQEIGPSEVTESDCAEQFMLGTRELFEAMKTRVAVQKRTIEVFSREIQMELNFAADLSPELAARNAQLVLWRNKTFDPKELRAALLAKLSRVMKEEAMVEAEDPAKVKHFLNVILCTHPEILYRAQKAALARTSVVLEAGELPEAMEADEPLPGSSRNVYGVIPDGLNTWERQFAQRLDTAGGDTILWWHRNPPHKPWSVNVLLPDGRGFYPDFIIGVDGRKTEDNALLLDTKFAIHQPEAAEKIGAVHEAYGNVLVLFREGEGRWVTVARDPETGKARLGNEFRFADTRGY